MKYIIFDFDGTIGDSQRLIVKTLQDTMRERGLEVKSDEACAKTIGLRLDEAFVALFGMSAEEGEACAATYREIFMKNNVRFRVIGDVGRLPADVQQKLHETEEHTAANTAMTMVVALSYSSRWEIVNAMKETVFEALTNGSCPTRSYQELEKQLTEENFSRHLDTYFMPDPELLIRTGGELRISNYLLWQIAYSELYFCDTYWPDFREEDLRKAIASYQSRQRRFGKTEAQVEEEEK